MSPGCRSTPEAVRRRPAVVLLDRDGVINADSPEHIRSAADWQPLPGSLAAIARLHEADIPVAVCTNQSGLARGLFGHADLAAIHQRMEGAIDEAGGALAGVFVCPHGPDAGCDCRKPRPGLLLRALETLAVPPHQAAFVGDSARDVAAAEAAGVEPILVRTGNGRETAAAWPWPVATFDDLGMAVAALLERPREHDHGD
ncbi:D-glycero-beta-D-manno-heptose-1,7-bisphosphate 7-phosphatase [Spiribacter halobius]|uniref:D,D-heptose 1,7-bisphosphate phosphatase n=1 Tax=Sediminicurvatus halobius TaxID=2182432 RepID=A0A2U2N2T7_9GAMM|nr:D-glycero-beta-D-manno-heptose-1,7-bisphosphate 7-phosphatase [Spiribacter halobius]